MVGNGVGLFPDQKSLCVARTELRHCWNRRASAVNDFDGECVSNRCSAEVRRRDIDGVLLVLLEIQPFVYINVAVLGVHRERTANRLQYLVVDYVVGVASDRLEGCDRAEVLAVFVDGDAIDSSAPGGCIVAHSCECSGLGGLDACPAAPVALGWERVFCRPSNLNVVFGAVRQSGNLVPILSGVFDNVPASSDRVPNTPTQLVCVSRVGSPRDV